MREFWWCALVAYHGYAKTWFGSVKATTEMEALNKLQEKWSTISPHPAPDTWEVHKGRLVFIAEDESC